MIGYMLPDSMICRHSILLRAKILWGFILIGVYGIAISGLPYATNGIVVFSVVFLVSVLRTTRA